MNFSLVEIQTFQNGDLKYGSPGQGIRASDQGGNKRQRSGNCPASSDFLMLNLTFQKIVHSKTHYEWKPRSQEVMRPTKIDTTIMDKSDYGNLHSNKDAVISKQINEKMRKIMQGNQPPSGGDLGSGGNIPSQKEITSPGPKKSICIDSKQGSIDNSPVRPNEKNQQQVLGSSPLQQKQQQQQQQQLLRKQGSNSQKEINSRKSIEQILKKHKSNTNITDKNQQLQSEGGCSSNEKKNKLTLSKASSSGGNVSIRQKDKKNRSQQQAKEGACRSNKMKIDKFIQQQQEIDLFPDVIEDLHLNFKQIKDQMQTEISKIIYEVINNNKEIDQDITILTDLQKEDDDDEDSDEIEQRERQYSEFDKDQYQDLDINVDCDYHRQNNTHKYEGDQENEENLSSSIKSARSERLDTEDLVVHNKQPQNMNYCRQMDQCEEDYENHLNTVESQSQQSDQLYRYNAQFREKYTEESQETDSETSPSIQNANNQKNIQKKSNVHTYYDAKDSCLEDEVERSGSQLRLQKHNHLQRRMPLGNSSNNNNNSNSNSNNQDAHRMKKMSGCFGAGRKKLSLVDFSSRGTQSYKNFFKDLLSQRVNTSRMNTHVRTWSIQSKIGNQTFQCNDNIIGLVQSADHIDIILKAKNQMTKSTAIAKELQIARTAKKAFKQYKKNLETGLLYKFILIDLTFDQANLELVKQIRNYEDQLYIPRTFICGFLINQTNPPSSNKIRSAEDFNLEENQIDHIIVSDKITYQNFIDLSNVKRKKMKQ